MLLTNENYHSPEANHVYMSVSQYKDFCGTLGKIPCEAQAMAKLKGEWGQEKSTALLVGSYVDAHFENSLALFKSQNPEIFTKQGGLRAEYKKAEEIISRIERDEFFMKHLSGEKQVIMTAELYGVEWKVKLDSFHPDVCIVDLKIMKSLRESFWTKDYGHMDFVRYWGYDLQAAIYQEVVKINTGKQLPFFIAGASKEKETDLEIIKIPQNWLDDRLMDVEKEVPKIIDLKNGEYDPIRCECCDYCKFTKVLERSIWADALIGEI